jgi:glycosyltransferase involved in cell wall biosynthesis
VLFNNGIMSMIIKQPQKVLFVVDHLDYGGAQTHLIDLVNNLSKEFHPSILLLSDKTALVPRLKPSIEVHKEIRRWRYDFGLTNRIASYIVKENYNNYFATSSFSFFFLCAVRKKLGFNFSINFILHSSQILNYKDFIRRFLFVRNRMPQDKFISTCQFQIEYFSKTFRIPSGQFKTIYNGIDINRFPLAPSSFISKEFKASLEIPDAAKVILQVATIRKEKGHQYSIDALKYLHKRGNEKPYLLIVGGGNELLQGQLRQITDKSGLHQYIKFCGMQEDLRPYYWISNLFTLSSIAKETFSISALIAMASGLPCVLTDVGGAREMVSDGMNGFVVPPKDPIALADGWQKVLNGALSMRSENIRNLVEEKFSLDSMVHSYETLIQ